MAGEMLRMARVLITVHSGAARFDVAVLANSPEALSLIGARYRMSDVRLKLWTDLEQGGDELG
jgi:hypothetical protein